MEIALFFLIVIGALLILAGGVYNRLVTLEIGVIMHGPRWMFS